MTNKECVKNLCNAIANTFYPDEVTIGTALFNKGIDPDGEAKPKDPEIFRTAVLLVSGYVEGSHSEGGVSSSVRNEAVKNSLIAWCKEYGLDAAEELSGNIRVITNCTNYW